MRGDDVNKHDYIPTDILPLPKFFYNFVAITYILYGSYLIRALDIKPKTGIIYLRISQGGKIRQNSKPVFAQNFRAV